MLRKKKRKNRPMSKSEQMARVRGQDTGPELALRRALWHAGLRYRVRPGIPGKPDLVFLGCKLAVFIDGCFWHGCPDHYKAPATNATFWAGKIEGNIARDRIVNRRLSEMGWSVLRFWEHELEEALQGVVERIIWELREHPPSP